MRNKCDTTPYEVALAIQQRREDGATWADIKHEFNMTGVTAQSILTKHGLDHSPNGVNRKVKDKWNRPCLICLKPETRPHGLFMCKVCRQKSREKFDSTDAMNAGYKTHL
jgi:hypothetical protein